MRHTVEQLLGIIYSYYPRGMLQDLCWHDTPEIQRLKQATLAAGKERKKWRAMQARMQAQFPACEVDGLALHLLGGSPASCYPGMLCLPRSGSAMDERVYFEVSFLAPYYALCSYRTPLHGRAEVRIRLAPDERDRACWEAIAREIETTYEVELMPPEIGQIIVPDVQPGNRYMGEAMIYDCLFDDCPRLRDSD